MSCYVTFDPAGAQGLVAKETTLAAAAERLGVSIKLDCGGRGECLSCRVVVGEGLDQLSWPTGGEFRLLSDEERAAGARLACQARVEGDCRVSVPPASTTSGRTPEPEGAEGRSEARERLRADFEALPPTDRAAAALEMQLKVAGDVLSSLVEAPLKVGGQIFDSIFGTGGTRTNDGKTAEGSAPDADEERDGHK